MYTYIHTHTHTCMHACAHIHYNGNEHTVRAFGEEGYQEFKGNLAISLQNTAFW